METYVVIAYRWGNTENHSYLVAVCDNEFIAKRYADMEAASRAGKYGVWVYKKIMNAPITETDVVVYKTRAQNQK